MSETDVVFDLAEAAARHLAQAGERVAQRAESDADLLRAWFTSWTAAGYSADLPLGQADVVEHLDSAYQHLAWSSLKNLVGVLARHHREAGFRSWGEHLALKAAVRRRRRDKPTGAQQTTQPLRREDIIELVALLLPTDAEVFEMQAAFAAVRAAARLDLRHPWAAVRALRVEDCIGTINGVTLELAGVQGMIDRRDDPLGVQALQGLLHDQPAGSLLSASITSGLQDRLSACVREALGRPWWSTGGSRLRVSPAELAALDPDTWRWVQRLADRNCGRKIGQLAYLLLGHVTAGRHIDLTTVCWDWLHCDADGISWALAVHKSSRHGERPRHVAVEHLQSGVTDCGSLCPACALDDWAEYQRRCWRREAGEVFVVPYSGQLRPITRQGSRARLLVMAKDAGLKLDGAMGARSLRAGAAVSAVEAGATIEEVRFLLDHADSAVTWAYLRRLRPESIEVSLSV